MARRSSTPPSEEQVNAIRKAVAIAGGQGVLAQAIGVTPSSVSNWCAGLTGLNSKNAKKVAKFTKNAVKDYELSSRLKKELENSKKDELSAYR